MNTIWGPVRPRSRRASGAHLPLGARREERGLSLVELLVAVTLILIGSLATLTMQRTAVRQNNLTDDRETAAWLARQLVERVRYMRYADPNLANTVGFVDPPTAVSPANNLNESGAHTTSGGFQRRWQIDNPSTNLKRIQVRVTWNESGQVDGLLLRAMLKVR